MAERRRIRGMDLATTLAVPARWRCRGALDRGVLLSAVAPTTVPPGSGPTWMTAPGMTAAGIAAAGILPTLRLVVTPVRVAAADWVAEELAELTARLGALVVDHEESPDLGGTETFHHRVHHLRRGTAALTEQWGWLVGGLGFTLTASAAAEDHDALAEVFAAVAASFAVGAAPASSGPGQSPAGRSSSDVTRAARATCSATA
jgi:hypothetical protein